jgi:L-alanine-DL-glutamate epimerase-like enolase superfamily enzyme
VLALPFKPHFHLPYRAPVDGHLALPDEPGIGITLDPTKVDELRPWVPPA